MPVPVLGDAILKSHPGFAVVLTSRVLTRRLLDPLTNVEALNHVQTVNGVEPEKFVFAALAAKA
jgi:hypothetical protein